MRPSGAVGDSAFHFRIGREASGDEQITQTNPIRAMQLDFLAQDRSPWNKFRGGNKTDGKHYWLTPTDLYRRLDAEFQFDFDPCPYPLPDGFDGLTCEWGSSNYVNPPFGSIMHRGRMKGPTAWVRKALEEWQKGRRVVFVYPVQKWVLMLLTACGAQVRNLGDIRWCAIEDGSPGPGIGQHVACFVLEPSAQPNSECDAGMFVELVAE